MKDNQNDPFIFIYDTIKTGPKCLIQIIKLEKPTYVQFFEQNNLIIFQNKDKLITQNIFEAEFTLKAVSLKTFIFSSINVSLVLKQHFYTTTFRKSLEQTLFYPSHQDDELTSIDYEPVVFELKPAQTKSIESSSLKVYGAIFNLTLEASNCSDLYEPIQILNQTVTTQSQLLLLEVCKHYLVYSENLISKSFHIFDLLSEKWYNISTLGSYNIVTSSCSNSQDFIFAILHNQLDFKQELLVISNLTVNNPSSKLIQFNLQGPYDIKLMNQIISIEHLERQFYYYDFQLNQLVEILNLQLEEISTQFFLEDNPDCIIFLIRKQNKLFFKLILLDRDQHQFSTRNLEVAFDNIYYEKNCFNYFQAISGFINQNGQFDLLTIFSCNGFSILANIIVDQNFLSYEIIIKHNLRFKSNNYIFLTNNKFIVLKDYNRLFWYWIDNQQELNINCYYSVSFENQQFHQLKDNEFYIFEKKNYEIKNLTIVNIGQYSIGLKQDHIQCETNIQASNSKTTINIPIILKQSTKENQNSLLNYCFTITSILFLIYIVYCFIRRRKLRSQLININEN